MYMIIRLNDDDNGVWSVASECQLGLLWKSLTVKRIKSAYYDNLRNTDRVNSYRQNKVALQLRIICWMDKNEQILTQKKVLTNLFIVNDYFYISTVVTTKG